MSEEKEEEKEEEYRNLPGWYSPSAKVRIEKDAKLFDKNIKKNTKASGCEVILLIIFVILVIGSLLFILWLQLLANTT